ncbi:synaptobrevin-domain-containing protein [Globomyces pollinis-pini]|nr:synaptobrevin-domain-containing protein [Globomyces pollinis-pini]
MAGCRTFNVFVLTPRNHFQISMSTDQVKKEVEEVTELMQHNINLAMARGDRLDDLQANSENLNAEAKKFSRTAGEVRKHFWWQDMKLKLIIGLVVLVVVGVAVYTVLDKTGNLPTNK